MRKNSKGLKKELRRKVESAKKTVYLEGGHQISPEIVQVLQTSHSVLLSKNLSKSNQELTELKT